MAESTHGVDSVRRIAVLGNHLPRRCGIATFTTDLVDALEREGHQAYVLAMNAPAAAHAYPSRVRFEIAEGDLASYHRAADFLAINPVDVLSVQHEYGIFGGRAGGHVLELLRAVQAPIVTTLHTILAQPNEDQRAVLGELVHRSERLVVMSADGAALLSEVHGVPRDKIDVIPHGIPEVPDNELSMSVGTVILTFGLLSPDKGIEYVIDAMPAILKRHPHTIYLVVGATHPHVKQTHGEAYRLMLQTRADTLGVAANVVFHNRFVSQQELVEFLGAADLYVTPYLKEEQSTSGTLAYAVGCGKAVVSTPYRYAREMLADERGVLVPFRDSAAIAREITALLDDRGRRRGFEERAAEFGRAMTWPIVARRYLESFQRAATAHTRRARRDALTLARRRPELPDVDLAHLRLMTDDTGLLQHALFDVPRYAEGYCLDDNARALLLMTLVEEAGSEPVATVRALATRYIAFVAHALDEKSGRFRNFLEYGRTFRDERGSEDSHGRAVWALGTVASRSSDPGRVALARRLLSAALPAARSLESPRAWAYVLLGIEELVRSGRDDELRSLRSELAGRLHERLRHSATDDWPWFEDRLTYCNARLPQALLVSAVRMGDPAMAAVAERSLEWLVEQHAGRSGRFSPIGTNGFHVRGGARADYDQQPVEACAMVSACLDAHRYGQKPGWLDYARRAFAWFLGQNSLDLPVYDARTGGCRDGIHVDRLNENQGAESTLSFLLALVELRALDRLPEIALSSADTRPMARGAS